MEAIRTCRWCNLCRYVGERAILQSNITIQTSHTNYFKRWHYRLSFNGTFIVKVICTHKTNAYDFKLVTLMVVDEYGEGNAPYKKVFFLDHLTKLYLISINDEVTSCIHCACGEQCSHAVHCVCINLTYRKPCCLAYLWQGRWGNHGVLSAGCTVTVTNHMY